MAVRVKNRQSNYLGYKSLAMLEVQTTLAVRQQQQPIHGLRQRRAGCFRTDEMNDPKVYNKLRKRAQRAA